VENSRTQHITSPASSVAHARDPGQHSEGPLGADPATSLLWVVLGAVVVVLAAIPPFGRRDLRTD
jgi:hypothetical protein